MARWFSMSLSVSDPFGCRCLISSSMLRLHIPLIEPDVRISRIRLSDWFHVVAHTGAPTCIALRRWTPFATLGLLLRRNVELSLELPDRFGSPQAHANPPPLRSFKSTQKQGPFPPPALTGFSGTIGLSDSQTGRCLMQRRGSLTRLGLPCFAKNLPHVPFPLPRRTVKSALVDCLLSTQRPSPKFRRVGVRIFTFEAYSGFTRVTAHGFASPPKRRTLSPRLRSQIDRSGGYRVESTITPADLSSTGPLRLFVAH